MSDSRAKAPSRLRRRLRGALVSMNRSRRTAIGVLALMEESNLLSARECEDAVVKVEAIAEALTRLQGLL